MRKQQQERKTANMYEQQMGKQQQERKTAKHV